MDPIDQHCDTIAGMLRQAGSGREATNEELQAVALAGLELARGLLKDVRRIATALEAPAA